ncbi:hypothetical protein [Sphingomonas yantingensis]|uniref:Uncharacterized protein n=1 Tax=Sphingomonas yantingensis TaxID=1241761 RepID=A0A7W9EG90_9SPHN|nr:hypothetical protein [Sphingomonas yantingensis]MBB5696852.1 hypothetical protein [Sphingomonas yantingensis]
MQQKNPQSPAFILERRDEMAQAAARGFFGVRHGLALDRDQSGHRRYHFIYEDLLM